MRRAPKDLIEVPTSRVLCHAVVELLSRVQRPYLFKVTVQGLPPHEKWRKYEVTAQNEELAADLAMKYFVDEMSRPQVMEVVKPTVWY
jgi:hypothetical protein